jgi:hypothetical protein
VIVSRGSGSRVIKWAASLGFIDVFGHKESLLTTVQKSTVLHDPIKQRTKLRSDLAVEFRNGLVTLSVLLCAFRRHTLWWSQKGSGTSWTVDNPVRRFQRPANESALSILQSGGLRW